MGRFEKRRERNKQLIADVLYIMKNVPHTINKIENELLKAMFSGLWSWLDLSSLLSLIRSKMIDLGKTNEFEILVKEFHDGDIINLTYSNWNLRSVIDFTTRLIVDFPEVIQAIAKDQEKEVK